MIGVVASLVGGLVGGLLGAWSYAEFGVPMLFLWLGGLIVFITAVLLFGIV